MTWNRQDLQALFVLLCLGVVYVLGASTTFQPADSAEFLTVAATAGIAHPSGYPLYTLLGAAATRVLPVSVPVAMAWLGALLTLLTLTGIYVLVRDLTGQGWAALLAALVGGVSLHLWKHATHPEAFALLGTCAIWLTVLAWRAGSSTYEPLQRFRYACGYALLTGLASSHHLTIALTAPVGLWMLWRVFGSKDRLENRGRLLGLGVALFAVGLLPYLHLVIRGANPPFGSWGQLNSLSDVLNHILRKEFGTFSSGIYKNTLPFAVHSFGYLKRSLALFGSFPLGLGLLWVMGMVVILRRVVLQRQQNDNTETTSTSKEAAQFGLVLMVTWLVCGPLFHTQLQMGLRPIDLYIVGRFYLLPDVFLAVFAGVGLAFVFERLAEKQHLLLLACGVWVIGCGFVQWPHASSRHQTWLENYARDVLKEVPKGGLLIEQADEAVCFGITYLQEVVGLRRDVRFVCTSFLARRWYVERMKKRWKEFRYRWNPRHIRTLPLIYHYLKQKRAVRVTTLYNRAIQKYFVWLPAGLTWEGRIPSKKPPGLEVLATRLKKRFKALKKQHPLPDWRLSPWPALTLQRYHHPWMWLFQNSARMGKKDVAKQALLQIKRWKFPYKPVTIGAKFQKKR